MNIAIYRVMFGDYDYLINDLHLDKNTTIIFLRIIPILN